MCVSTAFLLPKIQTLRSGTPWCYKVVGICRLDISDLNSLSTAIAN
uniref:Uncharacterized protein n=1 Tax=Zea mays TaxID=4577 RepID=B4FLS3_MAIZE|nr:unknown [Zea mays]